MMTRLATIILLIFSMCTVQGQPTHVKKEKVLALNQYVDFLNEGIHGMLIVHRLLENYNQEINKYVDLDSYVINHFSNKDLPKNIFVDKENWFYDTSPMEFVDRISKDYVLSPADKTILQSDVNRVVGVLNKINQLRFDLETVMTNSDLTQKSQALKVYEKLEEGVSYYENFYNVMKSLSGKIIGQYSEITVSNTDIKHTSFLKTMKEVYKAQQNIILSLRSKEDENFSSMIERLVKAIEDFETYKPIVSEMRLESTKVKRHRKNILEQSKLALKSAKDFYYTADVPVEYKQYGKFYFYYNSDIINNFNRYGSGIVFEMNNIIDYLNAPILHLTEMPHYFKVIYPKKLEKVDYIEATDSKITALPSQLKDRKISISKHKIKVDSMTFTVELYDHMIEDGDVISLNFNGDWILEKMPLTTKPQILKLRINAEGKNYFLLHAENVGRRPPNTMAVRYSYRGKKKQIILKSDLNTSEMIEITYVPPTK